MPDVVIMDISLPGMDGVLATRELERRAPLARVLIVTAHSEIHDVLDAMSAGAVGYALKSDGPEVLLEALQQVARGQRYVAPAVATRLSTLEAKRRRATHVLGVLSEREREIFRLAAKCLIAREIATELCIARKTVDTHLNRINHKLGLRNLAELVRLAANLGMIESGGRSRPSPSRRPARPPSNDNGHAVRRTRRCGRRVISHVPNTPPATPSTKARNSIGRPSDSRTPLVKPAPVERAIS